MTGRRPHCSDDPRVLDPRRNDLRIDQLLAGRRIPIGGRRRQRGDNITDVSVSLIATNCTQLTLLAVTGCENVTDASVSLLPATCEVEL